MGTSFQQLFALCVLSFTLFCVKWMFLLYVLRAVGTWTRAIPVPVQGLTMVYFPAIRCHQKEFPCLVPLWNWKGPNHVSLHCRWTNKQTLNFSTISSVTNIITTINVAINQPSAVEAGFVNRKKIHPINVQVICDPSSNKSSPELLNNRDKFCEMWFCRCVKIIKWPYTSLDGIA